MNKKELRKLIQTEVELVPRPKENNTYVSKHRNKWLLVTETPDETGLVFLNRETNHEFTLGYDNIRDFRTPQSLILHGQVVLGKDAKVEFELFADIPEADDSEEPPELIAERSQLAQAELEKLTPAEKTALRQLLVRGKMTDTDVDSFLQERGFGPYPNFFSSVSSKTPFLDREHFGWNKIMDSFVPALRKLLATKTDPF